MMKNKEAVTNKKGNEIEIARNSSLVLAKYMRGAKKSAVKLKILDKNGRAKTIVLPHYAMDLLTDILARLAEGDEVVLQSLRKELTTQQAADFLNVSRPFLIKLLEGGEIPCRKVGTRRRVLAKDVVKYKEKIDKKRRATLDALVVQSQELNLGYE